MATSATIPEQNVLKTSGSFYATRVPVIDVSDVDISYSKDEEALAHQKALFSTVNDDVKNDMKTSNVNFDSGNVNFDSNKNKKDRGSPSMITRIFCNRLSNNTDLNLNANTNDLQKSQSHNKHNINSEVECLSSNSIYDHIEAFTFEDFNAPPSKPEIKTNSTKPKQRNTANVNVNRLRKPNFPGYSESFKQILDKKNLLNIQKNKIQKRLSRKGEQLNKMVRRTESRFLKDRNKMNPNMTYDRRNCKNDVVNKEMVGGDVYVNVVKQPVVERGNLQTSTTYQNFDDLEEGDEVEAMVHDKTYSKQELRQSSLQNNSNGDFIRIPSGSNGKRVDDGLSKSQVSIDIENEEESAGKLRCEILTEV